MPDAEAVAAAEAADATAARRHGLGPTPTARFRAMLANPDKLNAIVDGMASALASVLSLKDADCDLDPRSLAAKPTPASSFTKRGRTGARRPSSASRKSASRCSTLPPTARASRRGCAPRRGSATICSSPSFRCAEPYCYFQECFRYVGQTRFARLAWAHRRRPARHGARAGARLALRLRPRHVPGVPRLWRPGIGGGAALCRRRPATGL